MVSLGNDWDKLLAEEFKSDYYLSLREFLKSEYFSRRIYPPMNDIYNALRYTSYENTRVVILGQDPYHEPGQAQGLAFYVPPGVRTPPSLYNIAKELAAEYPEEAAPGAPLRIPDLLSWADQGVLLLNATLTVEAGRAGSHQRRGWERFTDAAVAALAARRSNLVFLLWGSYAQQKGAVIDRTRHCVLESPHPSPLSAARGFFGCNHFRMANEYLVAHGISPVKW